MKTFRLFSMAALALAMAACSSEDNEILQNTQQPGTMHFTATIAAPSGDATTRTVYTEVTESTDPDYKKIKVAWEVGDQIALVHNGQKDVAEVKTVDDVTGKATIEADFTGSPKDNDDVYLAYPADAVVSATPYETLPFTPNPTTFNKVKNQDGTLEFIQNNLDFRMGSGKLAVSGSDVSLKESVSIPSLICIWKLTLQDNTSTPLNATQLTFKNNTDRQAKATSAAKSEYYLCVVPSFIPDASGTFSFEATVGGDTYTFSKTGLNLTAGKYYQSTLTMAKAGPTAYTLAESTVGMIVGSDGNAYAAADKDNLPTGVTVAGLVAYKSGDNGLAIALTDEPNTMSWDDAMGNSGAKAHTPAVTGQTWKLPSYDDIEKMLSSYESYWPDLNAAIANVGGTGLLAGSENSYWLSDVSDEDENEARYMNDLSDEPKWVSKGESYLVRSVIAF